MISYLSMDIDFKGRCEQLNPKRYPRIAFEDGGIPNETGILLTLLCTDVFKVTIHTTLETTQGQIDGFFSQLPYKCHQNRVASVRD